MVCWRHSLNGLLAYTPFDGLLAYTLFNGLVAYTPFNGLLAYTPFNGYYKVFAFSSFLAINRERIGKGLFYLFRSLKIYSFS